MFFVSATYAQFTISGEFIPRTEYRHGYKSPAVKDMDVNLATYQRTRLNFDFKNEVYQFFVSLQDVRTWGSEKQLVVYDGYHTTLHQAFAKINLCEKIALKAGHQEIAYDDHRIFGWAGWAPQGRSHDAAVLKYNSNGLKIDLGLAFNLYNSSSDGNPKAFQYLWLHKSFDKIEASFLALNNGVKDQTDATKIKYSQTIGTRLGYKADKLSAFLNLYYQGGKNDFDEKINANLIGLDLAYKVSDAIKLGLGYERLSGNDFANPNDEQNAFTPFYGGNHKFNGNMDYFYTGNHLGSVGLQDINFKLGYKRNKMGFGAHLHYFMSANDIAKDVDNYLGTELDLNFSYPIAKGVGFKVGYSHYFGTESLRIVKDGGDEDATSNWAWMMFVIKPTFFTTK